LVQGYLQNEWWEGIVAKPGRNYNMWLGSASGGNPYISLIDFIQLLLGMADVQI
jgi:hypothetical protein